MSEHINTIVVGGGQSGLALSYFLTQAGSDHVVLERAAQAGNAWRNDRWDSFTLVTPNWMYQMPGDEDDGTDPDSFMPRDELVKRLEAYVDEHNLPVRYNTTVTSIEQSEDGSYLVITASGKTLTANNVVIATGAFQQPKIPVFNAKVSEQIVQIHTSQYRNPDMVPEGAVLVVGTGQSGCQIAEELYQDDGRKVYVCVGSATRVPRRYRGRDIAYWGDKVGMYTKSVDQLDTPAARFAPNPHLTGKDGGHSLNLHQFARDGVTLLGHLTDIDGDKLIIAPDLHENLTKIDAFEVELLKGIDKFIDATGTDAPSAEVNPDLSDGYEQDIITEMSLGDAGISAIIWATGYRHDYSLVRLSIFDEFGYPVHTRGVTEVPGLYFLGLLWLQNGKSSLLYGVGEDAAYLAEHIVARD